MDSFTSPSQEQAPRVLTRPVRVRTFVLPKRSVQSQQQSLQLALREQWGRIFTITFHIFLANVAVYWLAYISTTLYHCWSKFVNSNSTRVQFSLINCYCKPGNSKISGFRHFMITYFNSKVSKFRDWSRRIGMRPREWCFSFLQSPAIAQITLSSV
jgi:hypothetical protein